MWTACAENALRSAKSPLCLGLSAGNFLAGDSSGLFLGVELEVKGDALRALEFSGDPGLLDGVSSLNCDETLDPDVVRDLYFYKRGENLYT